MAAPDTGRSWLVGICSVLFDIDVGPRVSNLIPGDQVLTPEEHQDIAFYAFPVSMCTAAPRGWPCSVLMLHSAALPWRHAPDSVPAYRFGPCTELSPSTE